MEEYYEMIFDACSGDFDEMERVIKFGKEKLDTIENPILYKCLANTYEYCERRLDSDREIELEKEAEDDEGS